MATKSVQLLGKLHGAHRCCGAMWAPICLWHLGVRDAGVRDFAVMPSGGRGCTSCHGLLGKPNHKTNTCPMGGQANKRKVPTLPMPR